MVQSTASDPSGSWSNTNTVGTSKDGSSAVRSVTLLISWSSGAVVGVQPGTSISGAEGSVSKIDSGVNDGSNDSFTSGTSPGSWGTDLSNSPLWVLGGVGFEFGVLDDWVDGGNVLLADGEVSSGGGEGGQFLNGQTLDEDDVGSPVLLRLESEGGGNSDEGSLGSRGQSLEGGDQGRDLGVTGEGLKGLVSLDLGHDLGQLEDGLGFPILNGDLKGMLDSARIGDCEGGSKDDKQLHGGADDTTGFAWKLKSSVK